MYESRHGSRRFANPATSSLTNGGKIALPDKGACGHYRQGGVDCLIQIESFAKPVASLEGDRRLRAAQAAYCQQCPYFQDHTPQDLPGDWDCRDALPAGGVTPYWEIRPIEPFPLLNLPDTRPSPSS